jgi:membrane-bound lytic murein transglycosylase D
MNISVSIIRYFSKDKSFLNRYFVSLSTWLIIIYLIKIISFHVKTDCLDYSNSNFKVLGLNLPTNLSFAGEKVPLNDFEIKESLEKEFFGNKSWKSSSIILFVKAKKWFPLIESILKKEGIPDDFKYVAVIESHLSNVTSPMGAAGFWQIMPSTAKGYGLIINEDVDERYDVEKSTYVACKHFKDGYNYFKNWTLSAAAYNVGIGGIQNALKKQNTNNYYDLLLNNETGSFIYRILAYKTLLSNPQHFGVNNKLKSNKTFPAFKIVKVDSSITNLSAFAKHLNTNVLTLKTFNAWLIGNKLTNTERHVYEFKIPKNKNLDISIYFADVFPQKIAVDTTIKLALPDSIKPHMVDTLKK